MLYLYIFYLSEEFLLDDIRNYRFLSGGKIALTGVDDSVEFRSTADAMAIMGIGPEEQACMLQIPFFQWSTQKTITNYKLASSTVTPVFQLS